jgi:hypothetical protein
MKKQDYIFVVKTDINEGFSTGTITKAALFFTKQFMFALPYESISVLGMTTTVTTNPTELITELLPKLNDLTLEAFEKMMVEKLEPKRIYEIKELEKFSIQVGFWVFGGMTIKKKGGSRQTINVQPKAKRAEIKEFYGL